MRVKIYTYTTLKSPRVRSGVCVYVVETKELPYVNGKNPVTEIAPIEDAGMHEAQLTTLLRALKRLRGSCDVEINTESGYIKGGVEHLTERRSAGWVTAKGETVKYQEVWEQIADILGRQEAVSVAYEPVNEWSAWMETEAEHKKLEIEKT